MFIDTHCHLSVDDYENIDQVLTENKAVGVSPIIISGCTKRDILESLEYANRYSDVFLTIGYHPSEADSITEEDLSLLEQQLVSTSKIVGLGEIGLDYYYGKENKDLQLQLFEKQLQLAEKLALPVVIHSRDATFDTIQLLKKYSVSGVIHCFSGSLETAQEYIKMGFSLGIGGVVTFKNSKLREVVAQLPLDKIVLETDSPYLTPEPFRGKKNSSKYIPYIAAAIANCKNISIDEVSTITTSNAKNIFHLDSFAK